MKKLSLPRQQDLGEIQRCNVAPATYRGCWPLIPTPTTQEKVEEEQHLWPSFPHQSKTKKVRTVGKSQFPLMHASWKISHAYLASEAPSCTGDSDHRDCDIASWRQNLSLPWNNAVKGLTSSLLIPPKPWSALQWIPWNPKFCSSRKLFQVSQKLRSQ